MTDTFTWEVTSEASGGGEFVTSDAKFGDGYRQIAPLGINNDVQKWSVTFIGFDYEVEPVLAFIRDKAGAESFFWTPPLGVEGYYVCKSYKPVNAGGKVFRLHMELEQVFFP